LLILLSAIAQGAQAKFYDKSYALVIGINIYPSARWPNLTYAKKDAQGMAKFLRDQKFKVFTLYDQQATKTAIIAKMQNYLAPRVKKNDRILFFFAGHGHTEFLGGSDWGYIVPYDGGDSSATYISMEEIRTLAQKMGTAKHQLFIMDACYGGLLGTKAGGIDPNYPNYLKEITRRKAKQIITAGGKDQTVLDGGPYGHSVFTGNLLEALREGLADLTGDGYITFAELVSYLVPKASNAYQTPAPGILPGHGLGEFVFRSPKGAKKVIAEKPVPAETVPRGEKEASTIVPPAISKEEFINSVGMEFVLIPAGKFVMGSPPDEPGRDDDERQHEVSISKPFYLQTTEVSQGQWVRIMGDIPSHFKGCGDYCPAEKVSWNDAQKFISKLNQMESTNKYRLPTEAEWEYACRAETKTPFFTGECISTDQANYNGYIPGNNCPQGKGRKRTVNVGSFQPNAWGLYDMHGNVWEWCQDWYGDYPTGPITDPIGPAEGRHRVLRGGSWRAHAWDQRSATRLASGPDYRGDYDGFRVARDF
jgi:formylglycine-generating enzyme required for sulfatase activity